MDYTTAVWQIGIIALVAGVMIGILAYRHLGPSKKEAEQFKKELDEAHEEMEAYKANVNQHFDKTSELVNDLTQNYVKVYQHLAEGAQSLGDSKSFDNLLEQHQGRVSIAVDVDTNEADVIADDSIVDPTTIVEEPLEDEPKAETVAEEAPAEEPVEAAEAPVESEAVEDSVVAEALDSTGKAEAEATESEEKVEASTVPADIDQDEASATRH